MRDVDLLSLFLDGLLKRRMFVRSSVIYMIKFGSLTIYTLRFVLH